VETTRQCSWAIAVTGRRQKLEAKSDEAALAADVSPPSHVEGYSKQRVELVQKAVKEWVRQLVDLGGRNNLLHYRDLKAGTLDLSAANQRALSGLLQGKPIRMASLFPDPEQREGALRRARTIHSKAKENVEERGIETLSLACGLATWDNKRGSWEPSAPVLLCSAALRPLGAARDEFELTLTDEMEVNPTLLHLLKADFDCDCNQEKLLDQIDGAIDEPWELEAAYKWLREHARRVPDFAVEPRLVLANFAYAKLPMVRDLEASFDELVAHELISAIAGDEGAKESVRAKMPGPDSVPGPDSIPMADEFLTLDADASQNYAINTVLGGGSLIVKGPPGTGKSQTIANLVGALVARGKRVLFVAEKRAAIDAVLKRLDQQGMGGLVLDLHGGAGSRRAFAQAIGQALTASRSAARGDHGRDQRRVERSRAQLNDYERSIHEIREPWGVSVYEARAELLGIPGSAAATTRFQGAILEDLTGEVQEKAADDLADIARLGGLVMTKLLSPWSASQINSSDEVRQATELLHRIRNHSFPGVVAQLERAAQETGLPGAQTVSAWKAHLTLWERAGEIAGFFEATIYGSDLAGLSSALAPAAGGFSRITASIFSRQYKEARVAARSSATSADASDAELLQKVAEAKSLLDDWRSLSRRADAPLTPQDSEALPAAHAQVEAEIRQLGSYLEQEGLTFLSLDELRDLLNRLQEDQPTLVKLPELHRLQNSLIAAGLAEFLAEAMGRQLDEDSCLLAFRDAWLRSILDHLSISELLVGAFEADAHDRAVAEFIRGDHAHIESAAARIRRIAAEHAVQARDDFREQAQVVQHQAGLKTRHQPVKDLVTNTSDVLLALKPCWAMSPLVVSQLLPSKPYFDVVVFDEASQITPADAVSSILRGRQLVVAGDERQLPPTAFFMSEAPEVEDDEEEAELAPLVAGTRGFESILDALGSLLPFRMLQWHYRSRDERLIAFSNAHIYDRMLTTFPGVGGDECLRFVEVPWQRGSETNSPTDEVNRVVELVIAHATTRPEESLGVISMGIKHAQRIEEAVRLRLRDQPELEDFFAEDREERFFVKNLERVQGDERDAIILSIGYGKGQNGQVVYRFGPLNLEGGERRLNVSVTRAKSRLTLVSSFNAREMDPERLNAQGAILLRQYLQYVESDGRNLGDQVMEKPALNPFEVDVRDTLSRRGLNLVAQYGCSGFWIDLAVKHPTQPGRYVLALECDGASYHSSESARDRDRLRQEQLERLGWRFHRIWSSEWFYAKHTAVDKVLAAYKSALENPAPGRAAARPLREPTSSPGNTELGSGPASRADPRPPVPKGMSIDQYTPSQLIRIIRWIESDDGLRTEDELVADTMAELGFTRRGSKIVEGITAAVRHARTAGPGR
jgi:very-short-patch-repair endonuclease